MQPAIPISSHPHLHPLPPSPPSPSQPQPQPQPTSVVNQQHSRRFSLHRRVSRSAHSAPPCPTVPSELGIPPTQPHATLSTWLVQSLRRRTTACDSYTVHVPPSSSSSSPIHSSIPTLLDFSARQRDGRLLRYLSEKPSFDGVMHRNNDLSSNIRSQNS
jgi:hypothetical protein